MRILCGLILASSFVIAQGVVGSGYTGPAPVAVAPGEIATFYISGALGSAGGTPTPNPSIIGVSLLQGGGNIGIPVQSLRPVSLCPDVTSVALPACGSLLAATVQIPYEVAVYCALCATPVSAVPPLLEVSVSGQTTTAFELNPLADAVHVLTECDIALGATPQPNHTGLPCTPLVTHADGTMVTASKPANFGEALTVWALGLGQTTPAAVTGQPAAAAPTVETFNLNFNYAINALPADPYTGEPDVVPLHPAYSGLAPGYVGLYQVNFVVPQGAQNGIEQCTQPGTAAPGGNVVQSNLTVSIGGQFSFDGAGICVATQIPVD